MIKFFSNLFKQSPNQPVLEPPTQQDKIRAFNSIVSILAEIQQGPPFNASEVPSAKPASPHEWLQLKLSNAFAHLAITDTEVAAATLHTPGQLSVLTWMQDQVLDDQDTDDQDEPGAAPVPQDPSIWDKFLLMFADDQDTDDQDKPGAAPVPQDPSIWNKLLLMFATNTKISDLNPKGGYQGPRIVGVAPPPGYPNTSDPKTNMLDYLDQFPMKWCAEHQPFHSVSSRLTSG